VPDLYVEFGRRLRAARGEADISQAHLGRAVGLSRASIANIEAGRQHVALDQLFDFARALGIETTALLPSSTLDTPVTRVPGLDREVARHGMDPALASVLSEMMTKALEESRGASDR